uniref:Acyl carrier protein n=1 Tax=Macrostomum lignano TaxID=282301 RepID=A0A1I8J3N3_9PLAT
MSLTDFISSVIGDDAELASFSSTDELDDFLAVSKMLHQLFEHSPSIRVGLLYEPADDILLALSRNQSGACGLVPIGNLSELT